MGDFITRTHGSDNKAVSLKAVRNKMAAHRQQDPLMGLMSAHLKSFDVVQTTSTQAYNSTQLDHLKLRFHRDIDKITE